jgi:lactate dehydrogenase-like 2-hydroxyacid dehydrogenase
MGHIAKEYLVMAKGMGSKNISYFNRTRKPELEEEYGIKYLEKKELFESCQLIYVAVSIEPGKNFIGKEIDAMSEGSIIISTSDPLLFDLETLYKRLKNGEIRGAFDENVKVGEFKRLPLGVWYTPNESSAFNTGQTIKDVSDSCVSTLINLLQTGDDKYLMNPEYKNQAS